MRMRIFIQAAALLMLVAGAWTELRSQGLPQRENMVLWYDRLRLPRDSSTIERPFNEEDEMGLVTRALSRKGITVISIDTYFRRAIFSAPPAMLSVIDSLPWVTSVMRWPEVDAYNDNTRRAIGADRVQIPLGPGWRTRGIRASGAGVNVAVFDISLPMKSPTGFYDLEWAGTIGYTTKGRDHATHVAGIVAWRGLNDGRYKGIAPGVRLRCWSIYDASGTSFNQSPPPATAVKNYLNVDSLHILQNSWSVRPSKDNPCPEFGTYIGLCQEYDQLVREKGLIAVFSAGNHRCTCYEALCGEGGYRTVMPPGTAKNVITVGAVDAEGKIAPFSSFGGTTDNRIVPHVVAPGVDITSSVPPPGAGTTGVATERTMSGTSMAAPAVSGGLALLVEVFMKKNGGVRPLPALMKGVLLNNAIDRGAPGPDMIYGYGVADIAAASDAIKDKRYAEGELTTSGVREHTFNISAGCTLKVMLTYSDVEGTNPTTGGALINDLDLTLVAPDNSIYYPLKLDPAHITAPAQPGVIKHDNTEQIVVVIPKAGTWRIKVRGVSVTGTQPQRYAVTWTQTCR